MRRKYSEPAAPRGRRGIPRFRSSLRGALGFALLGAALLAPTACSKRPAEPSATPQAMPQATPQATSHPAPQGLAAPDTPAKRGPAQEPATKPEARGAAPEAPKRPSRKALGASTRAFGLGAPVLARLPEDFSIGPLQDYRAMTGAEAGILSVARRFLEGMEKGKLDEELLLPESRRALALLLAPAESPAPEASAAESPALPFRVGRIALAEDGSSASLRVRLGCKAGEERLEGSLALALVDGSWYVEALNLDPPPKGGQAPLSFDPSRIGSL